MPNVLSFNLGSDPAGISSGIARAFREDPEWRVRSLVNHANFISYPSTEPFSNRALIEAWNEADVVHLHHNFRSFDLVRRGWAGRALPPKPFVVEFHGRQFREDPRSHLRELRRRRAIGMASTLDLYLLGSGKLEWAPAPVNVETMMAKRVSAAKPRAVNPAGLTSPDGRVSNTGRPLLIAHAPTNRQVKSTAELLAAVHRLQAEGFPVDLDLIERVPWTECLQRKARADIYFDQVILGYGCNALEAWGMGIPVVAGAADDTLDEMERRFGHLPFYHATEDTIYDALRELVEDPELRAEYGRIGYEYVRKYHDEPVVVEQLKGIYRRAMGEQEEQAA